MEAIAEDKTYRAENVFYSSDSKALIKLDDTAADFKDPVLQNDISNGEWALWGSDNRAPHKWADKMRKCGVLTASITGKARIGMGRGIKPVIIESVDGDGTEQMKFVNDTEIDYWMEQNHTFKNGITAMRNVIGWGWNHVRIILDNEGKKIARFKADDIVKCRMAKKNPNTGLIEKTYYSPNWDNGMIGNGESGKYMKSIVMLEEGNELEDLQERIESGTEEREFSMIYRTDLDGQEYYPYPMWFSTIDWVDLVGKIPQMKVAMMNNEISIKYIITISPKYFEQIYKDWNSYTSAKKQEMFSQKAQEINTHLSGSDKAYKSIVSGSYVDPATGKEIDYIRIQVLDDKNKDGKLLIDSSAGNKEILFSLMLNPAIIGANTFGSGDGGAGSGSDIREAYLVQIMLMEAERQMNNHIFNIVKHVNGWVDKFPNENLQFRYPNSVLTTLDKGGSMKPTN